MSTQRRNNGNARAKSATSMPAPSSQMIPNPASLSWNPDQFLSWDPANPLSWNNPERHGDGTRKDGYYEESTTALGPPAPGDSPVEMIQVSVPLPWPQNKMLSWNNPERDEHGGRKDGLYEKSTTALASSAPGLEPVTMINPPVPMSFPQDEPLSWNRADRDENGRRKDGLYETATNLIDKPVPLSWDQRQPLSWNRPERYDDGRRKDGLYETSTQMISDSIPLSWDQGKMLSWDADSLFMSDENLQGVKHVGIGQ